MGKEVPTEVTLEDKTANEQMRLVAELDEKDKSVIFGMIETIKYSPKRSLRTSLIKMWRLCNFSKI